MPLDTSSDRSIISIEMPALAAFRPRRRSNSRNLPGRDAKYSAQDRPKMGSYQFPKWSKYLTNSPALLTPSLNPFSGSQSDGKQSIRASACEAQKQAKF